MFRFRKPDKPIDWFDIALHTLPASFWAGMAGWMADLGYNSHLDSGLLLLIISILAWTGGIMFWIAREVEQLHDGQGFSRQGFLEWMIPAIAQIIVGPLVFLIL